MKKINLIGKERFCSECKKLLVRQPTECNFNWARRETCGLTCRFLRAARLKREQRAKAKKFPGVDIDAIHRKYR